MKILNPVKEVPLDNAKVEVRQLPFLKAVEFLKKLSALSAQLFTPDGRFRLVREGGGTAQFDAAALQEIIAQSGDLAEFLILHSTRKDRPWLEELSTAEGLLVLKEALAANTAPEIFSLGKEVAGVLKEIRTPAKTKNPSSKGVRQNSSKIRF
jgi:hypothetical protein